MVTDSSAPAVQDFIANSRGSSRLAIRLDLSIHFSGVCNSLRASVVVVLFVIVLVPKRANYVFVPSSLVLNLTSVSVSVIAVNSYFPDFITGAAINFRPNLSGRIIVVLRITTTAHTVVSSVVHLDFSAAYAFFHRVTDSAISAC